MVSMRRILAVVAFLTIGSGTAVALIAGYTWNSIRQYDKSYRIIQIGDDREDVVALFGQPEIYVKNRKSSSYYIDRFLVYRVDRWMAHPVVWTLGINQTGEVVSRHRKDDGC